MTMSDLSPSRRGTHRVGKRMQRRLTTLSAAFENAKTVSENAMLTWRVLRGICMPTTNSADASRALHSGAMWRRLKKTVPLRV
jgi:hypothetical protein